MTDVFPVTQAALLYPEAPGLSFDDLLTAFNADLRQAGEMSFSLGGDTSERFALFTHAGVHATVAIHAGPIDRGAAARAVTSAASLGLPVDVEAVLASHRAHMLISVADGPSPAAFDTPEPVPAELRVDLLARLTRLVAEQAPPEAIHLTAADRMYSARDIAAIEQSDPAPMLIHPHLTGESTSTGGARGYGLRAEGSQVLLGGPVLDVEGIPETMPPRSAHKLACKLLRAYSAGKLRLNDGSRVNTPGGLSLRIRHEDGSDSAPGGSIVASFHGRAPASPQVVAPFPPHQGYLAMRTPPASGPATDGPDISWVPPASGSAASERAQGSSRWMIFVGIGLLLWIGLPLLNIPETVIKAAFDGDPPIETGLPGQ